MTILDNKSEVVETVVLHKLQDKAAMHQMMINKGFVLKDKDDRKTSDTNGQKEGMLSKLRAHRTKRQAERQVLLDKKKRKTRIQVVPATDNVNERIGDSLSVTTILADTNNSNNNGNMIIDLTLPYITMFSMYASLSAVVCGVVLFYYYYKRKRSLRRSGGTNHKKATTSSSSRVPRGGALPPRGALLRNSNNNNNS